MLAASANGVSTSPMEGFDERRLCSALNIPVSRYTVPLVICAGYQSTLESINTNEKIDQPVKKNRRYPLKDICYGDKYNHKWPSLENEKRQTF
jgi:nitroreductase